MAEENKEQTAVAVIPKSYPLQTVLAILKDAGPGLVQLYAREIIEREVAVARFELNSRVAMAFSASGLFGDIQQVAQAITKIELGMSWGMSAADAMQHIYFVNGRPGVQNEYLGSKMRDAGMSWEIERHRDEAGQSIGCTLWPSRLQTDGSYKPIMDRQNGKPVEASISFMRADAERAGLLKKDTWKNFGEDMYYWRCIARLRRQYATNILCGAMTKDEVDEVPRQHGSAPGWATRATTAAISGAIEQRQSADVVLDAVPDESVRNTDNETPKPLWIDRNDMNTWLKAQKERIGDEKVFEIYHRYPGVHIASLRPEDPKALLIHAEVMAEPDKAKEQ